MIILLAITVIVTLLTLLYYTKKRKNAPPGPIAYPIIGSLHLLDPVKPYITLTNLAKKYGPIYGIQMGSIYTVVISSDLLIREAFKSEQFIGRAPLYVTHGIMGGYGKKFIFWWQFECRNNVCEVKFVLKIDVMSLIYV